MKKHKMPIFAINLESARDRSENIIRQFKGFSVQPTFISAYDGHDPDFPFWRYRHLAGLFWDSRKEFKPGAFCCYLSHAECWREIARGKADFAMVIEDDVEIDLESVRNFTLASPEKFDVVFVNQGTRRYLEHVPAVRSSLVGMGELITTLIADGTFSASIPAPGAYGYIVSRPGAEKLLRMMNTRGICMGVDYALVLHSLNGDQIEALCEIDNERLPFSTRCFLANERRASAEPISLESFVHAGNPLVTLARFESTIQHGIRRSNRAFVPRLDDELARQREPNRYRVGSRQN